MSSRLSWVFGSLRALGSNEFVEITVFLPWCKTRFLGECGAHPRNTMCLQVDHFGQHSLAPVMPGRIVLFARTIDVLCRAGTTAQVHALSYRKRVRTLDRTDKTALPRCAQTGWPIPTAVSYPIHKRDTPCTQRPIPDARARASVVPCHSWCGAGFIVCASTTTRRALGCCTFRSMNHGQPQDK